ncbi:peptidase inhibitor family I36 protein [Nonomuraea typhae]|uniref:Peptidase inhibitor family I36 protein n=1 Tax=Nonomuraea typhae TaxID=2603600 RepID=A0ABW7Z5K5_9ACTN
MGKKFHILALPIAAVALAALTTTPAQAADGYDRCRAGYYCMFSGLDGTGDIIEIQGDTPDLAALNMAGRAKSDWNRTSSWIHLYSAADYGGCSAVTSPAGTFSDKGNFFITFRDFWHSVKFDGPNGPSCSGEGEGLTAVAPDSHGSGW